MAQEYAHHDAIKVALKSEKQLMDFYYRASEMVSEDCGRVVFKRLADEKRSYIATYFHACEDDETGTCEEFLLSPVINEAGLLNELEEILDDQVKERRAREIAMDKEKKFESTMRKRASQIVDPGVRTIFEQLADRSQHHHAIIESEYSHNLGMPHSNEINVYVRE